MSGNSVVSRTFHTTYSVYASIMTEKMQKSALAGRFIITYAKNINSKGRAAKEVCP